MYNHIMKLDLMLLENQSLDRNGCRRIEYLSLDHLGGRKELEGLPKAGDNMWRVMCEVQR